MRISNLEFHQVIHDIEAENLEEKKSISMIIRQNSKSDVFCISSNKIFARIFITFRNGKSIDAF
jgi:hypothetical protein